jgi:autotransporter-associated beta strand protein
MNRPAHLRTASPDCRFRNKLIAPVVGWGLILSLVGSAQAGSATWKRNPHSGDWNTKTNWRPATVPDGSSDTARFALSNTTNVSISANTEVNGITFTAAATNPYTITASPGFTLTISGVGITNNSGTTQSLVTVADTFGNNPGTIVFSNSATAAGAFITNKAGGVTQFLDRSTAGNADIFNTDIGTFNNGVTQFFNRSTAGNATIYNLNGETDFSGKSSAGSANITDEDGIVSFSDRSTAGNATVVGYFFASIFFSGSSSAGNATLGPGDAGFLEFSGNSTASNATIGNPAASIGFSEFSSAGSASIRSLGGYVSFFGFSKGGTAQIDLQFNDPHKSDPVLDISAHNPPGVTIGSIEGDGTAIVFLGANNLTVGSNNLTTTFSGVIQDGGNSGGIGGSLTKIGTGTLDLTGANTYTGDTNINRGVLKVDGSITSNTFVNHGGTLAGTGTVGGNVTNAGVVSPGDAPGTLTVNGNYAQASNGTLLIDIGGSNNGQFSVLDVLGNANLDGFLHPVLLNGFTPTIGESFTFLDYASLTGAFSSIQNQVFDNGMERWVVTYQATDAVLTATRNVPDLGSTLLLLTLSLLGLVGVQANLYYSWSPILKSRWPRVSRHGNSGKFTSAVCTHTSSARKLNVTDPPVHHSYR